MPCTTPMSVCHVLVSTEGKLSLQKQKQESIEDIDRYDFPVHYCTQEQKGSHSFLRSFDNGNDRCCQERLLRSRNFDTMVK